MASENPNQHPPFDMHKLFKPPPSHTTNPPNPITIHTAPFPQYTQQANLFHQLQQHHNPSSFLHHQQQAHPHPSINYPYPPRTVSPNTAPNSDGAHLMALLGGGGGITTSDPSQLDAIPSPLHSAPSAENLILPKILPTALSSSAPSTISSRKMSKGKHLSVGGQQVYDIDSRNPDDPQPTQLEVTPITKYISDPGLVIGRQIAVNKTYICYGLKLGAIRVLNINTALRSLLRGHNQKVSDMTFFADDVHLLASVSVDGRAFVWKIDEGPDDQGKAQISGKIIIALQIESNINPIHPRACWHCHKQEVLVVGIGNIVLKIDTTKVGKGETFSAEDPLKVNVDKLIEGVQFVGKHDAEVTDVSMSQWMRTRLASASKDGMVKIWEDRKATPIATIRPHDGQSVSSVAFLTSPHCPEHIVLVTAPPSLNVSPPYPRGKDRVIISPKIENSLYVKGSGRESETSKFLTPRPLTPLKGPLNREVKIWASSSNEGWLIPNDSESWHCTQTLSLKSSAEPKIEDAFFNQVVLLPDASLILLANAKKNAIYAVHINYGPNPSSTYMDFVTEFTVTMPILSLTGTTDCLSDGEQIVQVYCVQTQAIQQYALELSQCLPPQALDIEASSDMFVTTEHVVNTMHMGTSPKPQLPTNALESASSVGSAKKSAQSAIVVETSIVQEAVNLERKLSNAFSSSETECLPTSSQQISTGADIIRSESANTNASDMASLEEKITITRASSDDISILPNSSSTFTRSNNVTHLITPSEILSGVVTYEKSPVSLAHVGEENIQGITVSELEVEIMSENGPKGEDSNSHKNTAVLVTGVSIKERVLHSDGSDSNLEMMSLITPDESKTMEQFPNVDKQIFEEKTKDADVPENVIDSANVPSTAQPSNNKLTKQKENETRQMGQFSPSASLHNSTDSLDEQSALCSSSNEAVLSKISTLQESLNQLITVQKEMQKEMQKQIAETIAVSITKEGRRLETSLGRFMEKSVKVSADSLWARFQEENAKREKQEKSRMQQITNHLTSYIGKELPVMFEKALKKEFSTLGTTLNRTITPAIEKSISSSVPDSIQRVVGDKTFNQLEKIINPKLETTVTKQIQLQFQTSGKQALQDALRSNLEATIIPAFEQSCKIMFDHVDTAFQKGMMEHAIASQKLFESTNTPLALTLKDSINSASSFMQNLASELVENQQKLLAFVTSGNQNSINSITMQHNNVSLGGLPMVEAPIDPKKELTRLISDNKFDEAFTLALQRSDVSIVSWICSQVDIQAICSMDPIPLSQGVLLALLQQLACDISNETSRKLGWMTDVVVLIDPADPIISVPVRPIFEHIYQVLNHQKVLPTTNTSEASSIRLILRVIKSVLMIRN